MGDTQSCGPQLRWGCKTIVRVREIGRVKKALGPLRKLAGQGSNTGQYGEAEPAPPWPHHKSGSGDVTLKISLRPFKRAVQPHGRMSNLGGAGGTRARDQRIMTAHPWRRRKRSAGQGLWPSFRPAQAA